MVRARWRSGRALTIRRAIVLVALGLGAGNAAGAEGIKAGTRVLARRPDLTLKVGARPVTADKDRRIFRVDKIQGDWLWLVSGSTKGWAKAANVVTLAEADAFFTAEIKGRPDSWRYLQRATVRLDRRDFDGALADYEEALRLDPKDAGAHLGRARVRLEHRDLEGAMSDIDEAIRLGRAESASLLERDHLADAYFARGFVRERQGDNARALADYDEALRLRPMMPQALNNRGSVRMRRHEFDRARQDFEVAVRLDPNLGNAHWGLGICRARAGDWPGALASFSAARRLDPRNIHLLNDRAHALFELKRYDEALADLAETERLARPAATTPEGRRTLAYILGGRGSIRINIKDLDGALADFDEAIRLDPTLASAHCGRGQALQAKRDYDGAIAEYDEALRLDPRDTDAHVFRAEARQQSGSDRRAMEDADAAVRLDPKNARAYRLRAWLECVGPDRTLHDFPAALADATRACELTSWKDPELLALLAHAHAVAGNPKEAVRWQTRALHYLPKDSPKRPEYEKTLERLRAHLPPG